jgi:DNA-binding response OmpR family regulator
MRAVVIDADDAMRGSLSERLAELRFSSVEAYHDPVEALLELRRKPADLVVLDSAPRGFDCHRLCQMIREDSALKSGGGIVVLLDGQAPGERERLQEVADVVVPRERAVSLLASVVGAICDRK